MAVSVAVSAIGSLTNVPNLVTYYNIPLTKGAFREGTFGKRSGMRCPRAD
jgi:hypothetical protein